MPLSIWRVWILRTKHIYNDYYQWNETSYSTFIKRTCLNGVFSEALAPASWVLKKFNIGWSEHLGKKNLKVKFRRKNTLAKSRNLKKLKTNRKRNGICICVYRFPRTNFASQLSGASGKRNIALKIWNQLPTFGNKAANVYDVCAERSKWYPVPCNETPTQTHTHST